MSEGRARLINLRVGFLLTVLTAGLHCRAATAAEAADDLRIESLAVGFDGAYKVGALTPVTITLSRELTEPAEVTISVPDCDGVPLRQLQSLNSGRTVRALVRFGSRRPSLSATLETAGRVVQRTFTEEIPVALRTSQELIVTIGCTPDLDLANKLVRRGKLDDVRVVNLSKGFSLESADALEGIDWIVAGASQPWPRDLEPDALERWVRGGGHLLVAIGELDSGEKSPAEPKSADDAVPLRRRWTQEFLWPGTPQEIVTLRDTGPLENYADATQQVGGGRGGQGPATLFVRRFSSIAGAIEAYAGRDPTDLPLVVRTPRGFGEIVFTPLDLDRPPLSTWGGRGQFLNKLLARPAAAQDDAGSEHSLTQLTNAGYIDLAGQLRGALDQFSDSRVLSFWTVIGLMLLYVLLISPLDYLLFRRWGISRGWAWLTFPAIVVSTTAGVYLLAHDVKGRDVQINQAEVIDFDQQTQLIRGTTWLGVYSPGNRQYDLAWSPPALLGIDDQKSIGGLTWFGLPGVGVGGLDSTVEAATAPLFDPPYEQFGDGSGLRGLPMPVWSSKSLVNRWSGDNLAMPLRSRLRESQTTRRLEGELNNPLPIPLRDAVLYYERSAFPIGKLEPGGAVPLDGEVHSIDAYLTERRLTGDKDLATRYDRFAYDLPRVLRLMMFHDAAGGQKYTQLLNRAQGHLDLSGQLKLGRAILVAIGDAGSEVRLDGQPLTDNQRGERLTIYRFVLPVTKAAPIRATSAP